ncbi:MAG: hypothetical protein AB1393_01640 [Candidatus Edwardsbacteria bacterium]
MLKKKDFYFSRVALLVLFVCASATAGWGLAKKTTGSRLISSRHLDVNNWDILTTNYGPFALPLGGNPAGYWPRGTGHNYIYGGGLWVAALGAGDVKKVAVGYNPNSGAYEFGPISLDGNEATGEGDPQARVYLSNDPADIAEWPVKDALGVPQILSRQDGFSMYNDLDPQYTFSGEKSVGVEVHQTSYAWNYADNSDIIFFVFEVKNVSGAPLRDVYLGVCLDCDIGNEAGTAANDMLTFDVDRNLAMQYQNINEGGWDKTGVVGFRFFESPVNNTGKTVRVIDADQPELSRDILPDSVLGMTAFKIFTIEIDPQTDIERYVMLQGYNYKTMVMDAYDKDIYGEGDKRFVQCMGPFNLPVDSIVRTCVGAICADDTTTLKKVSDVAQEIYNNKFQLAAPPKAPKLHARPGDNRIYLYWDRIAELTPDPYIQKIPDTLGWYFIYQDTLADTLLIKSIIRDWAEVKDAKTFYDTTITPDDTIVTLTPKALYSQYQMYEPYDFQGYRLYKAKTIADLAKADKRELLLTCDKMDGVTIVRDFNDVYYYHPGGADTLPGYDTLGTDNGLSYTYVDSNVTNGFAYYYGAVGYDYQPNVFLTRKCPVSLEGSPYENMVMVIPQAGAANYQKPTAIDAHTAGGATACSLKTEIFADSLVKDASYELRWVGGDLDTVDTLGTGNYAKRPEYYFSLYGPKRDSTLPDSVFLEKTKVVLTPVTEGGKDYWRGSPVNEVCFDGAKLNVRLGINISSFSADSVKVTKEVGGVSQDTLNYTLLSPSSRLSWAFRGSVYEIRWHVKGVVPNDTLTAEVWDITNNLQVPFESSKFTDMKTSSWAFGTTTTSTGRNYLTSSAVGPAGNARKWMYLCGTQLYFNKGGTIKPMTWSTRPDEGEIWTLYTSGVCGPFTGNVYTIKTTPPRWISQTTASMLDKIKVVPNPYLVRHDWDPSKDYSHIRFTHLPAKCTIRIYTLAGDLVKKIEHDSPINQNDGIATWDVLTRYDKRPASGIYLYHIDAPGIGTKVGKFAVIH